LIDYSINILGRRIGMLKTLVMALALVAMQTPDQPGIRVERIAERDGTHTLVHETVVAAPVADVWAAISTAEGWRSWAVPVAWTDPDDPEVIETAYDPAARPGQPQTIRQRFLLRVPGRFLAFRTIKAPAGFTDFDQFSRTVALFELSPHGARQTRVRLTGVGYPDSEAGRRLLGFFEEGNRVSLERLARRFSEGPIDWPAELRRPGN
jgi:uncharacterized protein YndB with AHSA1/START domain